MLGPEDRGQFIKNMEQWFSEYVLSDDINVFADVTNQEAVPTVGGDGSG